MQKLLKAFVRDDRGVSALEYAILAGIVVVALVTGIGTLSTQIGTLWTKLTTSLTTAGG